MIVKEGDICSLDESVEYSILGEKPFEVLVLWNGVNGQPLVTRTNEYRPFWTTYSQLVEVVSHIDLVEALSSIQPEQKIGKWITLKDEYGDVVEAVCSNCGRNGRHTWKYCPNCGKMKGVSE